MEKLVASLSPIERKVLPFLEQAGTVSQLAAAADIQEIEALRACQFLSNKGALEVEKVVEEQLVLSVRGRKVLEEGLPEQRFYDAIPEKGIAMQDLRKKAKLAGDEFNIAIGTLREQDAITIDDGTVHTKKKPHFIDVENLEEPELLLKRGLAEKQETTDHEITLTRKGKKLLKQDLDEEYVENLTSEMLKDGSWKDAQFRRYDVTTRVPKISYGRKHYVQEAIRHIKEIWVEMGFTEMSGTYTQSAYWDLDAPSPARTLLVDFHETDAEVIDVEVYRIDWI